MGNDITKKILLGLIAVTIAVTIVVTILDKTGCMDSLIKKQETDSLSVSTSETATDTGSLADETSETSHRLMYSTTIWSMFR